MFLRFVNGRKYDQQVIFFDRIQVICIKNWLLSTLLQNYNQLLLRSYLKCNKFKCHSTKIEPFDLFDSN